jgi:hypothetical protein
MPLKAGTKKITPTPLVDGYSGSMASAIEKAFLDGWTESMGGQPKPESNDQMRLLFIAIAQGVVKHLKENPTAFKVTFNDGTHNYVGSVTSIETDPV